MYISGRMVNFREAKQNQIISSKNGQCDMSLCKKNDSFIPLTQNKVLDSHNLSSYSLMLCIDYNFSFAIFLFIKMVSVEGCSELTNLKNELETIHLRRRQIFTIYDP